MCGARPSPEASGPDVAVLLALLEVFERFDAAELNQNDAPQPEPRSWAAVAGSAPPSHAAGGVVDARSVQRALHVVDARWHEGGMHDACEAYEALLEARSSRDAAVPY